MIDLTHPITHNMPKMPEDFGVKITNAKSVKHDGYHDTHMQLNMHTGTHIDMPSHMLEGKKRVNDYTLDAFIMPAKIVTYPMFEGHKIDHINQGDAVIIPTGHDALFYEKSYYQDYPVIKESWIDALIEKGVKMIVLDTPSPDHSPYAIHHKCFNHEIFIVENARNLMSIPQNKSLTIFAIPLLLETEASPIRCFIKIS